MHCKFCEYDFLYLLTLRNLDLYHTLRLMVNGRTLQERRWGLKVLFPLYLSSNSKNQLFLPFTPQGTDSSILPTSTPDPLHQEQRAIRTGHFHAIVPSLRNLRRKWVWKTDQLFRSDGFVQFNTMLYHCLQRSFFFDYSHVITSPLNITSSIDINLC